jgi:hypothetical protein
MTDDDRWHSLIEIAAGPGRSLRTLRRRHVADRNAAEPYRQKRTRKRYAHARLGMSRLGGLRT